MERKQLEQFIAIPTIAHDKKANDLGIEFLRNLLLPMGFETSTIGDSPYHQPVIVSRYNNAKSSKKIVLYGHYDVEKIKPNEQWNTPPFKLVEENGRYFCRGIADNKAVLLTRIHALQEMISSGEAIPNILWIIQGEEEVGGQTPFDVIPSVLETFGAKLFVEETGVYKKNGKPIIFHMSSAKQASFLDTLNEAIYGGEATIENRSLNKFSECPFLLNIPDEGHYIGFGPNDGQSNIHQANESLNKELLEGHKEVFKRFIRWANEADID